MPIIGNIDFAGLISSINSFGQTWIGSLWPIAAVFTGIVIAFVVVGGLIDTVSDGFGTLIGSSPRLGLAHGTHTGSILRSLRFRGGKFTLGSGNRATRLAPEEFKVVSKKYSVKKDVNKSVVRTLTGVTETQRELIP